MNISNGYAMSSASSIGSFRSGLFRAAHAIATQLIFNQAQFSRLVDFSRCTEGFYLTENGQMGRDTHAILLK
jgi:hypothetical protein